MTYFEEEPKIKIDLHNESKPYTLMDSVIVVTSTGGRVRINKGYNWNGADIPRCFWKLIGTNSEIEFLPASLVHDFMCENKHRFTLNESCDTFYDLLVLYGTNRLKAKIMMYFVWVYQKLQKGWKK